MSDTSFFICCETVEQAAVNAVILRLLVSCLLIVVLFCVVIVARSGNISSASYIRVIDIFSVCQIWAPPPVVAVALRQTLSQIVLGEVDRFSYGAT